MSKAAPTAGCGGTTAPSVTLGEGTPKVLSLSAVSTDTAHFQLSTNAKNTTNVNLKSAEADLMSGTNVLAAKGVLGAIAAGDGRWGMRIADGTGSTGTVGGDAAYESATNYAMEVAPVESTYGDTIASSTGAVVDANVTMTFAATPAASTAAGVYTGAYALIATASY